MRCGHAIFGSRVLVRSVPAVRPLIYLLTYLLSNTIPSALASVLSTLARYPRSNTLTRRSGCFASCHASPWSMRATEPARRPAKARPIRASRAHNSGDTHNAIQYRAVRDAYDRIHTGLTRRRSRQRTQRPANGHPEAAGSRTRARERARSSLSTAAPTPSTLGDMRPACPPPWPISLSIARYLD